MNYENKIHRYSIAIANVTKIILDAIEASAFTISSCFHWLEKWGIVIACNARDPFAGSRLCHKDKTI